MSARIAHIVPTDRIAFFLLSARLAQLRQVGFDVTVICGKVAFADELRSRGISVLHIPFAREIDPLTDLRCAWQLFRILRRERFDIVHSHNPKGGLLGPVVARMARAVNAASTVVVHTVHGLLFNDETPALKRLLAIAAERWTASWCDHLLFQSGEDFTYALSHGFKPPDRLHLIGNGIDQTRFDRSKYPRAREQKRAELGWQKGHLVVGIVGRLVAEKGFPEFFAMAAILARKFAELRFLVVGITEPDQRDALDATQLSRQFGIQDRCTILEQRRDMPELYACMDVAVLPSHREGIPRAIMEASAMGVPVVASDIRGCREVIVDRETGILFPARDVASFVAAVESLLIDASLRRRLGEAGSKRVFGNFTDDRTVGRLTAFYDEVVTSDDESRRAATAG